MISMRNESCKSENGLNFKKYLNEGGHVVDVVDEIKHLERFCFVRMDTCWISDKNFGEKNKLQWDAACFCINIEISNYDVKNCTWKIGRRELRDLKRSC